MPILRSVSHYQAGWFLALVLGSLRRPVRSACGEFVVMIRDAAVLHALRFAQTHLCVSVCLCVYVCLCLCGCVEGWIDKVWFPLFS